MTTGSESDGASMDPAIEPMRLMLVEDSASDIGMLTSTLAEESGRIDYTVVRTLAGALDLLDVVSPACVLLDLGLPDSDPDETMQAIGQGFCGIPVVVLTGSRDYETGTKALSFGAQDFLVKGTFDSTRLVKCIEFAVERQRTEARAQETATDAVRAEGAETTSALAMLLEHAPVGIGFIDRDRRFTRVNGRLAEMNGFAQEHHPGRTVAELLPDLWSQIEPLCEQVIASRAPVAGFETVAPTASEPGVAHYWRTSLFPVVVSDRVIGMGIVVIDVTDLVSAKQELEQNLADLVRTIAVTIEARDPYTAGHQERVAALAEAIGRELALDDQDIDGIRVAGAIHDVGKIAIPAELLTKPGRLTPAELALIKEHARIGFEILRQVRFPWPVAELVHQHHERLDGSGYPQGLSGDAIRFGAKVLAVADTVEAMSAPRPYRAALGLAAGLAEIERGAGTLFDAAVVSACIRVCADGLVPWDQKPAERVV